MDTVKLISLMSAATLLASCGNGSNPSAVNYGATGAQTAVATSFNTAGSIQTPLYSGNQIVGYKYRSPLFNGSYTNVAGPVFSQSVQINAGDQLSINMTNMKYGATINCHRTLWTSTDLANGGNITNAQVTLNGAVLSATPGTVYTAPAAGTLTFSSDLSQLNGIHCGWNNNRSFDVLSYWVMLGSAAISGYNGYSNTYGYGANAYTNYNQSTGGVVDVVRCTDTSNNAITCPY